MFNHLKFSRLKSSCCRLGIVLLLLATGFSKAAYASSPSVESSSSSSQSGSGIQPQVYVVSVDLDSKGTYKSGETISGTFTLYNYSDVESPGVEYSIKLVGGLGSNSRQTYDEVRGSEPVALKAKEMRAMSFSYSLPKNFSGSDVSIFVQAVTLNGLKLGWKASDPFEVAGSSSYLDILYSSVVVGGTGISSSSQRVASSSLTAVSGNSSASDPRFYPTLAGAFIYQNKYPQRAFVQFVLKNGGKNVVTVTPEVSITELRDPSVPLYRSDFTDHMISVDPGKKSASTELELPNFNWLPGIYKGIVSFKGADHQDHAGNIEFLYIIGGEQFNVRSLVSDVSQSGKNGAVNLEMSFDGTPFDTHSDGFSQSAAHPAVVDTVLFNERDEKMGENQETLDFTGEHVRNFSIQTSARATAMRAEVSVVKAGKLVKKYDFKLSPDYDAARDAYANDLRLILIWSSAVSAFVGIASLILALLLYKRRSSYKIKK